MEKCKFVTKFSESYFLVSNLSLAEDRKDYYTNLVSTVPGDWDYS